MFSVRKILISLTAAAFALASIPARAQGIAIVRDAEIENTLRAYGTPIWEAAGLDADAITVRLINSDEINSFVAGGQNIFFYTGLIILAQNANQVIGVIAHETGHIAGGHLAREEEEQRQAMLEQIISMILGAGAMAAGQGGAGEAVMTGGAQVAQRTFLEYSRGHEAAADTAALNFLDHTGQSARGFADFLSLLEEREHGAVGREDQYVLTHPLTPDRVQFVREHVENSKFSDAKEPPEFDEMFVLMKAKLVGFLHPFDDALRVYPETDTSMAGRYARAIAYYRKPDLAKAVPLIDGLIAERPNNPYFEELKGQMLYENGRVREAIPPYEAAVKLLPDNSLLRVGLSQAYLETNDPQYNEAARANLQAAVEKDKELPEAWAGLAVAYGREGKFGLSALALAEKAYLLHDDPEARSEVARAEKLLPPDSAGYLRAEDIKQAVKNRKKYGGL